MVFADWTFSGDGSGALDAAVVHAGASSYRAVVTPSSNIAKQNYLTHNTFSEPQAQVVLWVRRWRQTTLSDCRGKTYVKHNSYDDVECVQVGYDAWEKHRVTFWYDAGSNTKWGRDERWVGAAWAATGSDVNCGSGAPSAGSIVLHSWGNISGAARNLYSYFDELEVSA